MIALTQPLIGVSVGKWDRFATFGEKVQNGQQFTFSVETFGQIVDNFAASFRGRRLGMDYEHQAMNAPDNGQPAPELARYNALAVIQDGAVVRFHSQDAATVEPDPATLLLQIRERFPDDPDPNGLWGFRCEVTPMGRDLLPNYSQISPLFSADDKNENGEPVGYRLLNVSAVNVAFQDRTVLNLSHKLGFNDGDLHVPTGAKKKAALAAGVTKMEDEKEKEPASMTRAKACKALGLPDDASDDAFHGAVCAKMGDLEIKHEGEEEKMSAMSDTDEKKDDDEKKEMGVMSALSARINEESKARAAMAQELSILRKERAERQHGEWKAFSALYLDESAAKNFLASQGNNPERATDALKALSLPKRNGLTQRTFAGGDPVDGGAAVPTGMAIENVNGFRVIGRGLSALAQDILKKGDAKTIGEAQIIAAKRHPNLY